MGDIDPLARNVDNLQDSLNPTTQTQPEHDLVRLDVGQDGRIHDIQLSPAARLLSPDALVAEVVKVHTTAVEESQKAISAAIAALEADPRLAALTERRTDALKQAPQTQTQPTPPATSPSPATHPISTPSPPSNPTPPIRLDNAPAVSRPDREQPPARSRQPTREEEEDMDRYYGRKSWLEY